MFTPLPIKVFGKIVGCSSEPTQDEIDNWNEFERIFKYPDMLPNYKIIYMNELDSIARLSFLRCFVNVKT